MAMLREKMGAYVAQSGTYKDFSLILLTLRDPNVAATYEYFESLPEQIADMRITQEELDGYIMSSYSEWIRSEGELKGAYDAFMDRMSGLSQDRILVGLHQLKAVTPESVKDFASVVQKLLETGGRVRTGGAAAINANADLFDEILNPFAE